VGVSRLAPHLIRSTEQYGGDSEQSDN
jgi:hypothetical protein